MTELKSQSVFHEDFSREEKLQGSSDRSFGFVFAAFFALMGGLGLWHGRPHWYGWAIAAAVTLLVALKFSRALAPFNWLWSRLGLLLFKVISPLALAVIFFGTMTPMAAFLRLRKKDILRAKYEPDATSYWIARKPAGSEPTSMKNQF